MRWLKWTAVAAWFAFHAWLWTLLPPVPRWTAPNFAPHSLAFTPDGRSLVTADRAAVCVWDVASGRREHSWPRPGRRPDYENDRSLLVMSPTDRRVIVYDTRAGSRERPCLIDLDTGESTVLPAWDNLVVSDDPCIGILPDGRSAWQIDASYPKIDVFMRVWDLPAGPPRTFSIGWRLYCPMSVSPDGRRAVAVLHSGMSLPSRVLILDLIAGRVEHTLNFDRKVVGGTLSADGRALALAVSPVYEGGALGYPEVEMWDAEAGRRVASRGGGVPHGWTNDGRLAVTFDDQVRLLQAPDGVELARSTMASPAGLYSTSLAPGGQYLMCWDTHFRPEAIRWLVERLPVRLVDTDRQSYVCTIRDVQTGRDVGAVGVDAYERVVLATDGAALATCDSAGLRIWDMPPRRPGGLVLGVMIAQVGLLTAWTAWRRSRASVGASARRVLDLKKSQDSSG